MLGVPEVGKMWLRLVRRVAMTILLDVMYIISVVEGYVINAIVEEPQAITCWTCPNATTNQACNTWDHERQCPTNYTICQTIHRINVRTGQTTLVNKRCALPSECTVDVVGCHDTNVPGQKDCISCCNYPHCNELVPSNLSAALLYSTLTNSASSIRKSSSLILISTQSNLLHHQQSPLWSSLRQILLNCFYSSFGLIMWISYSYAILQR